MATAIDLYEVLGVSNSSEQEVIDAAYRALMKKYHPDRFRGDPAEADRRAKLINEAYETLRDPRRRGDYDRRVGIRSEGAKAYRPASSAQPSPVGPASQAVTEPMSASAAAAEAARNARRQGFLIVGAMAIVLALLIVASPGVDEAPPIAPPLQPVLLQPPQVAVAPEPKQERPEPAPEKPTDCLGRDCRIVTSQGWAGIKAGMTVKQAMNASGLVLRDDRHYDTAPTCARYEVIGGPRNVAMLVESGVITSISVYWLDDGPMFKTDRGVSLGAPESTVRAAYHELHEEPDIYSQPPDKELFYLEPQGERGIKFSINGGKVSEITFGGASIGYVEGCL